VVNVSFERTSRGVRAGVRRGGGEARAQVWRKGARAHALKKQCTFSWRSSRIIDVFCVGVLHLANVDD
jgi:hypothetical protein